jgi:YD repeat-containing protein
MRTKWGMTVLLAGILGLSLTMVTIAEGGGSDVAPASGGVRTITYSYDAAGRLAGANYDGQGGYRYTYDAAGNLLQRSAPGVTPSLVLPLIWR